MSEQPRRPMAASSSVSAPARSAPAEAREAARSTALDDPPAAKPPAPTRERRECPDCGGSIVGIKSTRCPRCGVNIISAIRRHESNAGNAAYHLDRTRRALVPLLASYGLLLLVLLLLGDPAGDGSIGDLGWFAVRQAVFVPMAVGLYWVMGASWLGFEQPFHLSVMGIMTAVAVSDTVGFVMWWVPVLFAYQMAVALTLAAVIRKTLELDYQEALIVGLTLGAVRYGVHVVLSQWF